MKVIITVTRRHEITCNLTTCGDCRLLDDYSRQVRAVPTHGYMATCDAFRVHLKRRQRDAMPLRCEECLKIGEKEKP